MDREILFRGKQIRDSEWIYGDLSRQLQESRCFVFPILKDDKIDWNDCAADPFAYEVDPNTVTQYTGLKDKNGVKIFEGDIVEISNFKTGRIDGPLHSHKPFNLEVVFFRGGFLFSTKNDIEKEFGLVLSEYGLQDSSSDSYSVEVIGNIYDNKNLIEHGCPLRKRFHNEDNS